MRRGRFRGRAFQELHQAAGLESHVGAVVSQALRVMFFGYLLDNDELHGNMELMSYMEFYGIIVVFFLIFLDDDTQFLWNCCLINTDLLEPCCWTVTKLPLVMAWSMSCYTTLPLPRGAARRPKCWQSCAYHMIWAWNSAWNWKWSVSIWKILAWKSTKNWESCCWPWKNFSSGHVSSAQLFPSKTLRSWRSVAEAFAGPVFL